MIVTHEISLDIKKNNSIMVQIPQYNKDTHKLVVTLTDNGQPFILPTQDYDAWLKVAGYGGNYYQEAMEFSTEDNTVSITLPESLVSFSGKHHAQIDIKHPTTHEQISTLPFYIKVPESVYTDDVVLKVYDFGELNRLIDNANQRLADIRASIVAGNEAIEKINTNFDTWQQESSSALSTFNTDTADALDTFATDSTAAINSFNTNGASAISTFNVNAQTALDAFSNENETGSADQLLSNIRTEANTLETTINGEATTQRGNIQDAADTLMSTINSNASTRLQEIQDEADQIVDAGLTGGFNVTSITSTNSTASNEWTGSYNASGLAPGKSVLYTMPDGSIAGDATLNLTLKDGTTTGTKSVKTLMGASVRSAYPAGAILYIVYDGTDWIVVHGPERVFKSKQPLTAGAVTNVTFAPTGYLYESGDENLIEVYMNGLKMDSDEYTAARQGVSIRVTFVNTITANLGDIIEMILRK